MSKKNSFFKIDLLILLVLKKEDCYGYEIAQNIKKYTDDIIMIKEGTMYPILWKLMEEKKITSYDKVHNGRNRVYYHLEPTGIIYLNELIKEFTITTSKINNFINIIEGVNVKW